MISILIADDDRDLVDTLETAFKDMGFNVVGIAFDGDEAAKLYSLHKPDVTLLDLNMPNYDGHYAIEKINQVDSNAKIIVITSYMDRDFGVDKVSAVFSKPYEIKEVVDKINQLTTTV